MQYRIESFTAKALHIIFNRLRAADKNGGAGRPSILSVLLCFEVVTALNLDRSVRWKWLVTIRTVQSEFLGIETKLDEQCPRSEMLLRSDTPLRVDLDDAEILDAGMSRVSFSERHPQRHLQIGDRFSPLSVTFKSQQVQGELRRRWQQSFVQGM